MARRPKSQAKRNGGSGTPGWIWLLTGLVVGAVAFAGYNLRDQWRSPAGDLPRPDPQAQAAPASEGAEPVVPEAAEKPKPKYEFYTLLPEKEVVIPDAELNAQARAEASAPPPISTPPDGSTPEIVPGSDNGPHFLIQAGAFRGSAEADALKAKIAMTGEIARVETAQINGTTVYRVRMGPYPNASTLAAAKSALANHGIDGAQALRVK